MRFSHMDGVGVATRIAGPSRHVLEIELGRGPAGEGEVGGSRESVATPSIKSIRYALDDPWAPNVYGEPAYALAVRAWIRHRSTWAEDRPWMGGRKSP